MANKKNKQKSGYDYNEDLAKINRGKDEKDLKSQENKKAEEIYDVE